MNQPLYQEGAQFQSLLTQTLEAALDYLNSLNNRPPATDFTPAALAPLPDEGAGAAGVLVAFLRRYGDQLPASNGPRFWGFVTGGTTPAALMADWLVSTYDLNLTSAANSDAPSLELEAGALLRQLLGLPPEFEATFVTGATMSNFAGLAMGREWAAQQAGSSAAKTGLRALPPMPVLSGAAHSSIYKALAMLGLGRDSLQPIALLSGREAVDPAALAQQLAALGGTPAIVVANAGTVNTVDFDNLQAIAALKADFPFWLHVDAAFGGFAACSPRYRSLLAGLALADSITVDAHKWLNVPYDAAVVLTRHRALQLAVFQNSAAYLGELSDPADFVHLAPENSRRLRSLPVWFTLMAYGRSGYQEIVERSCDLAQQLGALVAASEQFELLAPVRLNGVCFTLAADGPVSAAAVSAFLERLRRDGRVFLTPTTYQGVPAIRAAFSNWRTELADLAIAWQAMQDCAAI